MTEVVTPDIVQVEDHSEIRRHTGKAAQRADKTYFGYEDLTTFKEALASAEARAKLGYVLDGEFPERTGEEAEFMLPDAIKFLRETIADQTQIVVFSGAKGLVQRSGLLDLDGVSFMEKSKALPADVINSF